MSEPQKDPFGMGDDDGDTDAADAAAVARIQEAAGRSEPDDEATPPPVLSIGKTDDDDDDGPSRDEKKHNRFKALQERNSEMERRMADLEQRNNLAFGVIQELRMGQATALDGVYKEQNLLYREFQAKGTAITQAEIDTYEAKARELDEKKVEIQAERLLRKRGIQAADPNAAQRAAIQAKHADVYADQRALDYAEGYYKQQVALGNAESWTLLEESMNASRRQFKLGNTPAPDHRRRQRTMGMASTTGAGSGADPGAGGKIVMTKAFRQMADAMYSHEPDRQKRFQMWANGAGKRHIESQRKKP
jgi:hypothetical protein